MMQERRGPSLFGNRRVVLGITGLLLALAGLSVALVASAQGPLPVTVTKSAVPNAVEPGGGIVYTLIISNTGEEDISLEAITDTLPAGFLFTGPEEGPAPTIHAGSIVWTDLEDVSSGSSLRIMYRALVDENTRPAVYANDVVVRLEDGETLTATADVTVLGAILEGSKTASAGEVKVGEPLDYQVTIDNSGTSTATLTTIVDTLPPNFEYRSMLVGPAPVAQGDTLTWSGLQVGPGQSLELRYRVTAGGTVGSLERNKVQVTSPDGELAEMAVEVKLLERKFETYLPLVIRPEAPPPPVATYQLSFERQLGGNLEVYAVNADGTELQNISNMAGGDSAAQFSPDGAQIAWVHFVGEAGEILVANADGSEQVNVTNHAKDDRAPSWSPDGTKIAFHSLREEGRWEVYSMDADGSNVRRLTDRLCQSHDALWSPDGTKIAFICGLREFAEVYVMDADGSNWQRLTEDPTNAWNEDTALAWSPDSTRLAYVKYRVKDRSKGHIYVVNVNTKHIQQITSNEVASHGPAWSPDGSKIAFSYYCNGAGESGTYDIVVADASNPQSRQILTNAPLRDTLPRWSSDGTKIAFMSNRLKSSVFKIYVMDADGSNEVQVTTGAEDDRNPNWRPQPE